MADRPDAADPPVGTYEARRAVIPRALIDDALRLLHIDLLRRGASTAELSEWLWGMHRVPHLRQRPPIVALREALPDD